MDKFWERYIQSRPAPGESKGAFDAFAAAKASNAPLDDPGAGRDCMYLSQNLSIIRPTFLLVHLQLTLILI